MMKVYTGIYPMQSWRPIKYDVPGTYTMLIMHDHAPEVVTYQFCLRDQDPHDAFEDIPLEELTTVQLYTWMKETFSVPS
jgi:hypothetical protein